MKTLYFDCSNGISGDMVLNALAELSGSREAVLHKVEQTELLSPGGHGHPHTHEQEPGLEHEHDHNHEQEPGLEHEHDHNHEHEHEPKHEHDHEHKHKHQHSHAESRAHSHGRSYREVRELINGSSFTEKAKDYAKEIYRVIAQAEAEVHGATLETVHFHEVGRDEAIKNVLGIGMAMELIEADKVCTSKIFDGRGSIVCSHGEIPVPVPAVAAMMKISNFEFDTAPVETEMVTPSGLAALMGIGAVNGRFPAGEVVCSTEARGKRDTGRGGLKVYIVAD